MMEEVKPIIVSKFRKLQETGLEAELYFQNNFKSIDIFKNGIIEDARLFGDGYDFQISSCDTSYLAEVKGIREKKGRFRLTQKEYSKALEYKDNCLVWGGCPNNFISFSPKHIRRFIKNLRFNSIPFYDSVKWCFHF